MNREQAPDRTAKERARLPKRCAGVRVEGDRFSLLLWNINRIYCRVIHRFSWQSRDPLPGQGPAILVCNHRSSVDPFILAACTRRVISYLVAQEYCEIRGLRWFLDWMRCVPVRRDRQDVGAVRRSLAELRQGRLLCIFPEGGIGRGFDNPQLGMAYLSLKSGAPVFPAYVSGTPLADSVWKSLFTPSRSRVMFGPRLQPPSWRPGTQSREQLAEWADRLLEALTDLAPPV